MKRAVSLRVRLTAIILLPLMTCAILAGLWQLGNARRTAAEVFDRSLLSAALAVANDVAISEGDALSTRTRDILASTSGGQVFYHVYAPDGVIVAGYATPPVGIPPFPSEVAGSTNFEAIYLGRDVSGVRLQNRTEIDGFAGIFTTTVWQDSSVRTTFVRDLVMRSFIAISTLILALALIVWFGVRLGLRPLIDLEHAIEQRTGTDLSAIKRPVPSEVAGIVATLNRLFGQVSRAMTAQSDFIANAAHQLRNPIAGVLALAESVVSAPTAAVSKDRAQDLLEAARDAADLSQKLLMLERAESLSPQANFMPLDLATLVPLWVGTQRKLLPEHIGLQVQAAASPVWVRGDETMLREALVNLIDNALRHGGQTLRQIDVTLNTVEDAVVLSVQDDGQGLAANEMQRATERFVQVSESSSSGLGLSIVKATAIGHGGELHLHSENQGLCVTLRLPIAEAV